MSLLFTQVKVKLIQLMRNCGFSYAYRETNLEHRVKGKNIIGER